ncbi:MAG: ABC transporter permease [Verrucomicrobiae bacterium]|nr:ABC transporter permease [Verrucomicrobiae bacterium]
MTIPGFILRNAFRNKRRLILTVLSVALSLFLFTVLQTALRELTQPATSEDAALRVVVRHRVSLGNVLPEKYQYRIERTPGVMYCSKFTWFGGIYKDEKNFFPQFACEADKLFNIFTESVVDPKQLEDFIKERTACIVGIKTMDRFRWKIGDKINLMGSIWPCDPELTIRGVYTEGIDETNLFFHHEYMDELMGKKGLVGMFWIRATTADAIPDIIKRIDDAFRNTDAETKTETERAFQLGFVSMFGNIKMLIGSICTVIVFTMILVTASTMSMAIRERSREIAILKAVGFDGRQVFGLILAESFGLAVVGGVIGCFGAWFVANTVDMYKVSQGFFIKFEVSGHILANGLMVAALLGVISCIAPAIASIKQSVVGGLKTLD